MPIFFIFLRNVSGCTRAVTRAARTVDLPARTVQGGLNMLTYHIIQ